MAAYTLNKAYEGQTVTLFVTCKDVGGKIHLSKDTSQKALAVLHKIGHPAAILVEPKAEKK